MPAAPRWSTSTDAAPLTRARGRLGRIRVQRRRRAGGGAGPTGPLPPGSETPLVVPAVGVPPGPTLIPGIYLPPEVLVASADAFGATLIAALPCDEVFDVLAAGEWEVVSRTEPTPEVALLTMFAYGLTT